MYRGGGLFSVTSKILVNDFLSAYACTEGKMGLTSRGYSAGQVNYWTRNLTRREVSSQP